MANTVILRDKKLRDIIKNHPARAEAWLSGVAEEMVSDMKLSMGTSPKGRAYKRKRVTHIASVAGYPPNVDTGALRASIKWERAGTLTRRISDGVAYGIHLEQGGQNMAPRPFMGPVFSAWQRKIADDAKRRLVIE